MIYVEKLLSRQVLPRQAVFASQSVEQEIVEEQKSEEEEEEEETDE